MSAHKAKSKCPYCGGIDTNCEAAGGNEHCLHCTCGYIECCDDEYRAAQPVGTAKPESEKEVEL